MHTAAPMLYALLALLWITSAHADENETQESSVPISKLFSITLRDIEIPSRWQSQNQTNIIEFRPLIPFEVGELLNVMRITVPYRISDGGGSGLGDVRIFDLISFRTGRGLWGIGPVVNLRGTALPQTDKVQGGFVFGSVTFIDAWAFGVLNQNLFSNQIAASTIQPVLTYRMAARWTVGLGELPFVFNWKSSSFVFVPIGFQVSFQAGTKAQSFRLFVNPQYNTQNLPNVPQWTFTTGITLPLSAVHTKSSN